MRILRNTLMIGAIILASVTSAELAGAEMTMSMWLAPHCTETERSLCPKFDVIDGTTLSTGKLSAGDILDLDVIVSGAEFAKVRTVRSWLNYDPAILEYRSVELTKELPSPTPGEQTGDSAQKLVKIGGSTDSGLSAEEVAVARVTFRVLATTENISLSFYNFQADGTGHAAINGPRSSNQGQQGRLPDPPCIDVLIGCRGAAEPMLAIEPSKLNVQLKDAETSANLVPSAAAASLLPSDVASIEDSEGNNVAMQTASAAAVPESLAGKDSTFGILQVQGVKVTTKDSMVFIGWNELKSAGLKGYNVYYSTVSGRYIQRHSVPKTETSLTLRNLAADTTYYFAVRAVNDQDEESVFSQEVSVTVGRPETASAPLAARQAIGIDTTGAHAPEGNPMEIHDSRIIRGETGVNDILMFTIGISAIVGTAFAFRRQLLIHNSQHHAI